MSPKSLLRHKLAVSDFSEMGPGTSFRRVIREIDDLVPDKKVRRVVLCSGKVYYDLLEERRARKIDDVAIVRVEQLYPWPRRGLENELIRYPNAEIVWCQEEPANMGSWTFVLPRLMNLFDELGHKKAVRPIYVGRPAAASPATGLARKHTEEQTHLVDEALTGKLAKIQQPFSRLRR
jgi:2-oxoglutarate dehydrogenase E1 component